jgi:serine/threonine-protein kinase
MPAQTETSPALPVIAGYEIHAELGRGPLGKVYRAREIATGHIAVFRGFTRPPDADSQQWEQAVARFKELLANHKRIDGHPAIQKIYTFGEEGPLFYIASEYFDGRTIRSIIDNDGPQPLAFAIEVFRQVAEAVDYAAIQGQCHTDITPYNILLTPNGSVRVINFGLGHSRDKTGSPYVSPEQLAGFEGDLRSDVYGMGAVLYELLGGRAPFTGETASEVVTKVRTSVPAPLLNQPPYVRDILAKMLAKSPSYRYATASEAIQDLSRQQAPLEVRTGMVSTAEFGRYELERRPSLANYALSQMDLIRIHLRQ